MTESNRTSCVVSVIVPLYNCAPWIQECLSSLQAQTFSSFEVLCVDDASQDNSLALAQQFAAEDKRFNVWSLPENGGQSVARNAALEKAQGEYLVLVDADDALVPEALEKLVARARAQQLDDLYFSGRSFYESREVHALVREDYSQRTSFDDVATGPELFTFFEERNEFFPQGALRMVRRDVVERNHIRFYEGIIHEDLLFTFQTLVVSKRSSFLNEPLYRRRIRAHSTMTQPRRTIANVRGHEVCISEMNKWLRHHAAELSDDFMRAIAHRIHEYRLLVARDWFTDITEEEKEAYVTSLSPDERLDFYTNTLEPGATEKRLSDEFYQSVTYRLGNAFLCVPRALRNRLQARQQYKKDE